MKKNRKKKIIAAILAIVVIFLVLIIIGKPKKKKKQKKAVKRVAVSIVKIKPQNLKERVYLTGEIRGDEEVRIFSFVTGVLRRKFVQEGTRVGRGSALFSVDQSQRGLDILDHVIRSPIPGVVTDINMDIGDQVIANQTVISRVVQTHRVKVKLFLGMRHIGNVKIGNKALIKISSYRGRVFEGRVNKISPTVDPNNRTVEVEVIIDNRDGKLKSGMFAEVEIITNLKKDKVLVPQESVLFDDNMNYVYKYDKKKKIAVRQVVKIGNNYSGQIEILDGIKKGDLVINRGQYNVFSGFPVRVTNESVISETDETLIDRQKKKKKKPDNQRRNTTPGNPSNSG